MLAAGIRSAAELGRACGTPRQTAERWLRMREPMLSGVHLIAVSKCLRVRMRWLATGEGAMATSDEFWRTLKILEALSRDSPEDLESWLRAGERMAAQ